MYGQILSHKMSLILKHATTPMMTITLSPTPHSCFNAHNLFWLVALHTIPYTTFYQIGLFHQRCTCHNTLKPLQYPNHQPR